MRVMEPVTRFCPACLGEIEEGEPVIFFEREMYHPGCVPGARHESQRREPRF